MLYFDFEVEPRHCTSDSIVKLDFQIRFKESRYVTSQLVEIYPRIYARCSVNLLQTPHSSAGEPGEPSFNVQPKSPH